MTIRVAKPNSTFIHIPKTGGVSISNWLIENQKGSWYKDKHAAFKSLLQGTTREKLGFTFTVIRNPFARVVSAYHYNLKRGNRYADMTFEQYLNTDFKMITSHKLASMAKGVDLILRFETLEEDFKQIQDFYNCYVPLPHKNKSKHDHYRSYYNDKTRKMVEKRLAIDLETYNYEY